MARDRPFISQRSIQKALDSMLFGRRPTQPNPLENLILVENVLGDPTLPDIENARSFALFNCLIDLIRHEFQSQHRVFNLEDPGGYESRSQIFQLLSRDASFQVPELIGWGLLYCRYVRVDLNIRLPDLLGVLPVDIRTLRRYQSICIKRLTEVVAHEEWLARQEKYKRRLYSQLPSAPNIRILGRDALLKQAMVSIENNSPPRLLITGPEGIGKTAFVQVLVKSLIDSDLVDKIIWLTRPPSVGFVLSQLKQTLLYDTDISLKEYTILNRLILVVDDMSLVDNAAETSTPWGELGDALVILTNQVYRQFGANFIHLVLPEIDERSVAAIVAMVRPHLQNNERELHTYVAGLYGQVGGNPLAIKLAANSLSNMNLQQPLFPEGEDLIRRLIASSYEAVSQSAQTILLLFALLPPKPVTLLELSSLWTGAKVPEGDMIALLSCGLLDKQSKVVAFIVPDSVRLFVQWLYTRSGSARSHIEESVSELTKVTSVTSWVSEVIEYILLQDWLNIDPEQKQTLAELGAKDGIAQGHYAAWSTILEDIVFVSQSTALKLCYAICLRQLLDFTQAEALFREVIDFCERKGDFLQQGRGLLELGTLSRQQGLYEQAQTLIGHARSVFSKWEDQALTRQATIELAQVLLDSGDIGSLKAMVADLSVDSANDAKATLLLAEILVHLKDYRGARLYAERAAKHVRGSNLGRIYALLGRIASEERDFDGALDRFDLAVTQLEQGQDWYGLARAKSNLAAVLIQQRQYLDDAEDLLLQAQATQRSINDRAGMVYTAHNVEALNAAKWIDET